LILASSGDCSAYLLYRDGSLLNPMQKHVPSKEEEKLRIESADLIVSEGRVWTKNGDVGLNVSRSMGDFHLKGNQEDPHKQGVTVVPEFWSVDKELIAKCLLVSDGVTDVLSSDDIQLCMEQNSSEFIVDQALQKRSTDNCSALLMVF
jgi:serine/threonine protein phosphatase PrpC